MTYTIHRYSLSRAFISIGKLIVKSHGVDIHLEYSDEFVSATSCASHHPIRALEQLRQELEIKHSSLLGCAGCRIDSAYRATGHCGTYLIEPGLPATHIIGLFEPTDAIELLCTVSEHKLAYLKWCDFFIE